MKKFILLLCIILLSIPVFAQPLTGEVSYTIEDAKIELQNNRPIAIDFLITQNNFTDKNHKENYSALLKGQTKFNDRTLGIFSDGSYAINYKNDKYHVWYYDKDGNLINTEEKTSIEYPYRSYKYTPDGELINMSLRTSENETFIFSPFGELLGHWIGENCYDENRNIIMSRKIINFK